MKQLKSWTTIKNSALYIALSILVIGLSSCQKEPNYAYIDFSKIPLPEPSNFEPIPEKKDYTPATRKKIKQLTLSALPEKKLFEETEKIREKLTAEVLDITRNKKYPIIFKELKEIYESDINIAESKAYSKIEQNRQKAIDQHFDQIRDLFLKYSVPSGVKLYELTNLVGFPDPDPESLNLPDSKDEQEMKKYNSAKALREDLAKLDQEFRLESKRLLEKIEKELKVKLNKLRTSVDKLQRLASEKAKKEAEQIIKKDITTSLPPKKELTMNLPPVKESKITIKDFTYKHEDYPVQRKDLLAPIKNKLKQDAQLWADLKGYELVEDSTKGLNVTEDFIKWRNKFRLDS